MLKIKEEEKISIRKLVKRFQISPTTLFKWTKRIEAKITIRQKTTKINMISLKKDVEENLCSYQYERARKFSVSQGCIGYALRRLGALCKKTLVYPKVNEEKLIISKNNIAKYDQE